MLLFNIKINYLINNILIIILVYLLPLILTSTKYSDSVNLIACDGELASLHCPPYHQIIIESANFGRFALKECNPTKRADYNIFCNNPEAINVLKARCEHRQRCVVPVNWAIFQLNKNNLNNTFEDQCSSTSKYLDAVYGCIRATTTTTILTTTTTTTTIIPTKFTTNNLLKINSNKLEKTFNNLNEYETKQEELFERNNYEVKNDENNSENGSFILYIFFLACISIISVIISLFLFIWEYLRRNKRLKELKNKKTKKEEINNEDYYSTIKYEELIKTPQTFSSSSYYSPSSSNCSSNISNNNGYPIKLNYIYNQNQIKHFYEKEFNEQIIPLQQQQQQQYSFQYPTTIIPQYFQLPPPSPMSLFNQQITDKYYRHSSPSISLNNGNNKGTMVVKMDFSRQKPLFSERIEGNVFDEE